MLQKMFKKNSIFVFQWIILWSHIILGESHPFKLKYVSVKIKEPISD